MVAKAERLRKKEDLEVQEVLRSLRGFEKNKMMENHVKNIMNIEAAFQQ